ncbi:MAG: DUF4440 domain-containing protein [Gammaproteobacteria bacterium]
MQTRTLVVLIGGAMLFALGWAESWAGDREDVAATTAEWACAFNENDANAILRLYDDKAVLWGTTSQTLRSTSDELHQYFSGPFNAVAQRKISDLQVDFGDSMIRIYRDTAINTGYYTFSWTQDEEPKTLPARFSFVYAKRGDSWKIVDHHSSKIP